MSAASVTGTINYNPSTDSVPGEPSESDANAPTAASGYDANPKTEEPAANLEADPEKNTTGMTSSYLMKVQNKTVLTPNPKDIGNYKA